MTYKELLELPWVVAYNEKTGTVTVKGKLGLAFMAAYERRLLEAYDLQRINKS